MANNINILKTVSNLDVTAFEFDGLDASACLEMAASYADSVKVYSFRLSSGAMNMRIVNLAYNRTDSVKFVRHYLEAWYSYELANIDDEYAKFAAAFAEDDSFVDEMEAVRARYDNARKVLSKYVHIVTPDTIKALVIADRKGVSYPKDLQQAFIPVSKELKKLNKDGKECAHDFSILRKELTVFCNTLWKASDDGAVEAYTFNANARLTENVFRVAMIGLTRNKSGLIVSRYANGSALIREVTLACFEELQRKRAEAEACAEEEKKSEEKKSAPKKSEEKKSEEKKSEEKKSEETAK